MDHLDQIAAIDECAIIVIDTQNEFLAPGGWFERLGYDIDRLRRILPDLSAFLDRARQLGVNVIFVRHQYDRSKLTPDMLERSRLLFGSEEGFPSPGSWGEAFCEPVLPLDDEPVITKHWYNAFSNPQFEELLQKLEIKTLVLTGGMTHVCVETTARASNHRDYRCIIVEDCVTGNSADRHRTTLSNWREYFGWVCTSQDLLTVWEG